MWQQPRLCASMTYFARFPASRSSAVPAAVRRTRLLRVSPCEDWEEARRAVRLCWPTVFLSSMPLGAGSIGTASPELRFPPWRCSAVAARIFTAAPRWAELCSSLPAKRRLPPSHLKLLTETNAHPTSLSGQAPERVSGTFPWRLRCSAQTASSRYQPRFAAASIRAPIPRTRPCTRASATNSARTEEFSHAATFIPNSETMAPPFKPMTHAWVRVPPVSTSNSASAILWRYASTGTCRDTTRNFRRLPPIGTAKR